MSGVATASAVRDAVPICCSGLCTRSIRGSRRHRHRQSADGTKFDTIQMVRPIRLGSLDISRTVQDEAPRSTLPGRILARGSTWASKTPVAPTEGTAPRALLQSEMARENIPQIPMAVQEPFVGRMRLGISSTLDSGHHTSVTVRPSADRSEPSSRTMPSLSPYSQNSLSVPTYKIITREKTSVLADNEQLGGQMVAPIIQNFEQVVTATEACVHKTHHQVACRFSTGGDKEATTSTTTIRRFTPEEDLDGQHHSTTSAKVNRTAAAAESAGNFHATAKTLTELEGDGGRGGMLSILSGRSRKRSHSQNPPGLIRIAKSVVRPSRSAQGSRESSVTRSRRRPGTPVLPMIMPRLEPQVGTSPLFDADSDQLKNRYGNDHETKSSFDNPVVACDNYYFLPTAHVRSVSPVRTKKRFIESGIIKSSTTWETVHLGTDDRFSPVTISATVSATEYYAASQTRSKVLKRLDNSSPSPMPVAWNSIGDGSENGEEKDCKVRVEVQERRTSSSSLSLSSSGSENKEECEAGDERYNCYGEVKSGGISGGGLRAVPRPHALKRHWSECGSSSGRESGRNEREMAKDGKGIV